MHKEDSLSFPTVLGSGGCGLSLLKEICVGAKWSRSWFLWSFNMIWKLRLMWFEINVCNSSYVFFYDSKFIWCCDKLWFLGVSIVMRRDLQRSIIIHLNLAIYCESWWYTLQTYLRMDSVQTIKKTDGFLRLIVFTIVKSTSTNKEICT